MNRSLSHNIDVFLIIINSNSKINIRTYFSYNFFKLFFVLKHGEQGIWRKGLFLFFLTLDDKKIFIFNILCSENQEPKSPNFIFLIFSKGRECSLKHNSVRGKYIIQTHYNGWDLFFTYSNLCNSLPKKESKYTLNFFFQKIPWI